MRLLVTGGAGFIGSEVAEAALRAGWEVRLFDSLRPDVHAVSRPRPRLTDGAEFIRGDMLDPAMLDIALEGVDAVCHQAAKVGLGVDISDTPDYVRTNVLGTAELTAAMSRAAISRLVLASSMVVYGEGSYLTPAGARVRPAARAIADLDAGIFDPRDPASGDVLTPALVDEDARLDPRNVYATTKLAQEHLSENWSRETGGKVAMLRYHNVYGPGMPRNTPYAGVASLFRSSLERGEAPQVYEDGAQRRDFVHVRDIAAANISALEWTAASPPGSARAFNAASGTVTTVFELAAALSRALGGAEPVITGEYRAGDVRHITASAERAATELGWRAAVDFTAGITEFATSPQRR